MKLYKTTFVYPDTTTGTGILKHTWHGSADDASKGRTGLKAAHPGCKPSTAQHDVPTNKVGLLSWLNTNAV